MNIPVTKPFVPELSDYVEKLAGIWRREWFTNNGPLVNELELSLKEYLKIEHLLFVSNGTIAIQIAIKALNLKGEIITTPFSYVATTSSIVWENALPVMVDIKPDTLNIDEDKIEAAITPRTSAILATHVFGNPCNVEKIQAIADKHNLKVIYDAAHAFGTTFKGKSIFEFGDVSTCSFHATKLFHTVEGGALVTRNPEILKRMAELRNFGHVSATEFGPAGINGKNSEVHAAMGLCNLPHIEKILEKRKSLYAQYIENCAGIGCDFQKINSSDEYNCSYFPIIFDQEKTALKVIEVLNLHGIYPRRYFYPSLSKLPYVNGQDAPISESIACRILCLPMYSTLSSEEVDMICRLIKRTVKYD